MFTLLISSLGLNRAHLESRSANVSYMDFGLKPAVFGCLNNAIAPPPIALESCSNTQNIRQIV